MFETKHELHNNSACFNLLVFPLTQYGRLIETIEHFFEPTIRRPFVFLNHSRLYPTIQPSTMFLIKFQWGFHGRIETGMHFVSEYITGSAELEGISFE